jgi:hypothetical protein
MDTQEARATLETRERIVRQTLDGTLDRRYVDWERLQADCERARRVLNPPQQPRSAAGRVVLVGRITV